MDESNSIKSAILEFNLGYYVSLFIMLCLSSMRCKIKYREKKTCCLYSQEKESLPYHTISSTEKTFQAC